MCHHRLQYKCNGEQLTQQTNKCHKQTNIVGEVPNYTAMETRATNKQLKRMIGEEYLRHPLTSLYDSSLQSHYITVSAVKFLLEWEIVEAQVKTTSGRATGWRLSPCKHDEWWSTVVELKIFLEDQWWQHYVWILLWQQPGGRSTCWSALLCCLKQVMCCRDIWPLTLWDLI